MGMRLILEKTLLLTSMVMGNSWETLYSGVSSILPVPPEAAAGWAPSPSDPGACATSSTASLEHAAAMSDRANRAAAVMA